jgi:hypothetical protein
MVMRSLVLHVLLLGLVGCIDQVDQRWELDHDHVVAVRATPPAIMPGERAKLDALLAHTDQAPTVNAPVAAAAGVDAGDPLATIVSQSLLEGWSVTAPSADILDQIRARDGIAATDPVPVPIVMAFTGPDDELLYATKTIYLGITGENPIAPAMVIDGQLASDQITVPMQRDVYVSVNVESAARVNWLTSCGSLFQDDVPTAFLRVASDDNQTGQLAVVIREPLGGVAWRVWPVTASR